jgi:3-oxoacyl-[acyl-carrier protein] reductase
VSTPGAEPPKVAVVTGASRGIGRATALALARRGVDVALLARPSEELDEATADASKLGARAHAIACDVAKEAQVEHAAREVERLLGAPTLVVSNAGIVRRGALVHETDAAEWDAVIATNLRGGFLVARAFLPSMLRARRGRFVMVASISATIGCPSAASYAASKWGLVGLMKSLADELRGTGLQAMAILPGSVDTEMLVGSGFEPAMSADEVARAIVQLGLDAPDALSGAAVEMFG